MKPPAEEHYDEAMDAVLTRDEKRREIWCWLLLAAAVACWWFFA